MAGLANNFAKDYKEFYSLKDATHPATGEKLYVATYLNGKGADILSESDLPHGANVDKEWSSFVRQAEQKIKSKMSGPVEKVFSAYKGFVGQSKELTSAIQKLDLMQPNYIDAYFTDYAAELIGRLAQKNAATGQNV